MNGTQLEAKLIHPIWFDIKPNFFSPITQYIFTYHFLFATLTNSRPILTSKIKLSQQKKCSPTPMPNCLPYEIIFRNWLQLGIGNFRFPYRFQPKFQFRNGFRFWDALLIGFGLKLGFGRSLIATLSTARFEVEWELQNKFSMVTNLNCICYSCTFVRIFVCVCICICLNLYVFVCWHLCLFVCVCLNLCLCFCLFASSSVCVCV